MCAYNCGSKSYLKRYASVTKISQLYIAEHYTNNVYAGSEIREDIIKLKKDISNFKWVMVWTYK